MGDGLERGLFAARTPVPERGRQRRPAAPSGDRPALATARTRRARATRLEIARARPVARRIPIYAIALGTPGGQVELRDSFGFLQRDPGPAGHRDPEGDRAASRAASPTPPPRPTRSRRSTPTSARGSPPRARSARSPPQSARAAPISAADAAAAFTLAAAGSAASSDVRLRPDGGRARPRNVSPLQGDNDEACMFETVVADELHEVMEEVRERTFQPVSHLDEGQLEMAAGADHESAPRVDLGHVAAYEDLVQAGQPAARRAPRSSVPTTWRRRTTRPRRPRKRAGGSRVPPRR